LARDARPDIQFHFVPAMLDDHGRNRLPGDGFTLHACALRPRSRGWLELASRDPLAKPRIHANYLGDEGDSDEGSTDLEVMLEALDMSRAIFAQPAFARWRGPEIHPGDGVRDRAGLVDFIRRKAETVYHP